MLHVPRARPDLALCLGVGDRRQSSTGWRLGSTGHVRQVHRRPLPLSSCLVERADVQLPPAAAGGIQNLVLAGSWAMAACATAKGGEPGSTTNRVSVVRDACFGHDGIRVLTHSCARQRHCLVRGGMASITVFCAFAYLTDAGVPCLWRW